MTATGLPDKTATVNQRLNLEEMAGHFEITPRTLKRWNKKYRLPRFKIGMRIFYDLNIVNAHLQQFHSLGGRGR